MGGGRRGRVSKTATRGQKEGCRMESEVGEREKESETHRER